MYATGDSTDHRNEHVTLPAPAARRGGARHAKRPVSIKNRSCVAGRQATDKERAWGCAHARLKLLVGVGRDVREHDMPGEVISAQGSGPPGSNLNLASKPGREGGGCRLADRFRIRIDRDDRASAPAGSRECQ